VVALASLGVSACDVRGGGGAAPPPEILGAPAEGELAPMVQREDARARGEGRRLVVYVGATWCEPCERFKKALAGGALDVELAGLRLLELDADRDQARLESAGCGSSYLPLFALPEADGRCSARERLEGSIKGEGAVAEITPRLRRLVRP
jgi:thiol-disulfide isomerase/thioredoxin